MIESTQNPSVKRWKKLQRKRTRDQEQAFLVEGFHLVEEALKSQWKVLELIVREDVELQSEWSNYPYSYVSSQVFNEITETEQPQGIAAVVRMDAPEWQPFERILILDAVQDPGNLGTLIRTADAAGFDAIICGKGTVDPFNDKVLRATQGSVFHIPFFKGELLEWVPELQNQGVSVWATSLKEAKDYTACTPSAPVALIVGNEGAGVNETYVDQADERVMIPIYGRAESLNVGIAAGILMYYLRN
ncbi:MULTISPECIES: TrmH family RNA methyltransferase [Pontibacillus]|uniref:RNA methyltransferase n=1 Tax=Pontibacillus chungwhensis TaxID=265426 RepID=A0ABY8UXR5_9BACI|nr:MULTISPECIES: RNA methyltransferase [Pontibacillus]MCD5323801.1 RNA methyltransferase [Pontibacillus sp. HN14]WIF97164.1 RNA methyltransferase [Pontibacillus chungwhensis]